MYFGKRNQDLAKIFLKDSHTCFLAEPNSTEVTLDCSTVQCENVSCNQSVVVSWLHIMEKHTIIPLLILNPILSTSISNVQLLATVTFS